MARFEGAAKVLVDNKGVTLSGAFGLPPRAHPDDARRAVTAAETLRRELEDDRSACTVGVATGRAFCGVFGSDLRREYTLHGEVVNLAARAHGGQRGRDPLLRTRPRSAAHESVGFEALEPVTLKGRAEPVAGAPRVADAAAPTAPARVADGRPRARAGERSARASTTW